MTICLQQYVKERRALQDELYDVVALMETTAGDSVLTDRLLHEAEVLALKIADLDKYYEESCETESAPIVH